MAEKRRRSLQAHKAAPVVRRGTVRLSHDIARRIRNGHPWVYREALDKRVLRDSPGSPIELVDEDGEFIARGFFDGETAISVRVVSRDRSRTIGPELYDEHVVSALALRRRLLDFSQLQAMRLIHAENDGLPGLVVDRYGDYLVSQLFTSAVDAFRATVYDALERELAPTAIYEQRRFRSLRGEAPRGGAELVRGTPAPVEIEVQEDALRFYVDVTAPLSTGLFADLREGRRAIAAWARDRRVLNLFSYTGAISVYARHGGAAEVVAVDVSPKSHARARKNLTINGFDGESTEHLTGDAFKVLARFKERKRCFDMVVIDPPAFSSGSRGGKPWSAVRDYSELVAASLDVLVPGGLLVAASSTHKLPESEFEFALADGAGRVGTRLRIVDRRSLPVDFPVAAGFPEANYLKFAVAVRD
jgi:23S rRNA (cytosine1962-C5)-methyltransferase